MIYKWVTYIMFVLLVSMSIVGGQHVYASPSYADVPSSNEAFEEINYLTDLGVIKGYAVSGKTYFKPNNAVTRGQAAKMVVLAAGYTPLKVSKSSYTDVEIGTELSGYVERAAQLGLFKKSTDGKFYPNGAMLRSDMSYIIAKAFNMTGSEETVVPFSDISTGHPYYEYIRAIYENGITQGSQGKFNPDSGVTRSQFALFVARAKNEQFRLDFIVQGVNIPSDQYAIGKVKVTVDDLNIRSTPNSSSTTNRVGQVDTGTILSVFTDEGDWLKVAYNGKYAYVFKKYTAYIDEAVQPTTPKPTPTPVPTPTQPLTGDVLGRVVTDSLNVRAGAGVNYDIIGSLKRDDKVSVMSVSNNWIKINYNNKEGYISKTYVKLLNQKDNVLKNRIIVLDPGHGGKDPGAVSESATEKAIVFKVASLVRQKLEANGAKIVMTRTGDTYPTLQERVDTAVKNYGEMFVSIHVNAAASTSAKGTETYYSVSTGDVYLEDIDLATFVNEEIVKNAEMNDRGVKKYPYYVINNMAMPSILVELGFITNSEDRVKLVNDEYVEKYAQSIYNGIVKYYTKQ